MDKYINQLLEDFGSSIQNAPDPDEWLTQYCMKNNLEPSMVDVPALYDDLNNFIPIEQVVGIEKYYLPTLDKLNEKQVEQLHNAIVSLFEAWKIEFLFPEKTPLDMRYATLYESWTSHIVFIPLHTVTFKMCQRHCETCQFEDFCTWTLDE